MPELDRDAALDWVARWDSQQLGYLPDREERFTALIDAVQEGTSRPDPLVLDLGAGPGSLAVRLLDRLPAARDRSSFVGCAPSATTTIGEYRVWNRCST